jgi:hypothetical protein
VGLNSKYVNDEFANCEPGNEMQECKQVCASVEKEKAPELCTEAVVAGIIQLAIFDLTGDIAKILYLLEVSETNIYFKQK